MEILEKFRRSRLAIGVIAGGVLLGACARTTTEGITTQSCVPVDANFHMRTGDKIYLGDISSDQAPFNGPKNDWAYVKDLRGQLVSDHESRDWHNTDDGSFAQTERGLTYTENGNKYNINILGHNLKTLDVNIQTDC